MVTLEKVPLAPSQASMAFSGAEEGARGIAGAPLPMSSLALNRSYSAALADLRFTMSIRLTFSSDIYLPLPSES